MKFKFSGWQLNKVEEAQCGREAKLRQMPGIDEFTGLANYCGLSETVETEIKRSKRSGREFSALVFDLIGTKQINARYGHLAGDRAFCRLAHIFHSSCRIIDTAARYGDDKFAVILPECRAEGADIVARRIGDRLSMDSEEPLLSVNVGFAVYPGDGETLDTLFEAAVRVLHKKMRERADDSLNHSRSLPFVISQQKRVFPPTEVDYLTYAKVGRMAK